ncbi:unnamed protein product [Polarella glacialis]|uniref:EF-hand domain-containing protein n=1 Tax=Polarella glacialis TaxID=89957 RepID=A0A813HQ55_POLGL|nr:unnamed protein product [Polarella glacialis]
MASRSSSSMQDTHQRLLELESLITQAGEADFRGAPKPAARRPSSAGAVRPSSAGARRPSASAPQRPQSARSVRPQSARAARPAAYDPEHMEELRRREKLNRDREWQVMCDMVGHKAATKYKTVNQAFRLIDTDHDGVVEKIELRVLFQKFHLTEAASDRFFDLMDLDGNGYVDFHELTQVIGPYIQPGYAVPASRPKKLKPSAKTAAKMDKTLEERKRDAEISQLGEIMGTRAHQKYKHVRDCFRFVDEDKDGLVERHECVRFLESFGFDKKVGDRMYDMMLEKCQHHKVDWTTFVHTFGPYITPGYYEKLLAPSDHTSNLEQPPQPQPLQRPASARPSGRPASARPSGRPASARPSGRPASARPSGRPASARPSGHHPVRGHPPAAAYQNHVGGLHVQGVSMNEDSGRPRSAASVASTASTASGSSYASSDAQVSDSGAAILMGAPLKQSKKPQKLQHPGNDSSAVKQRIAYMDDAVMTTTSRLAYCGPLLCMKPDSYMVQDQQPHYQEAPRDLHKEPVQPVQPQPTRVDRTPRPPSAPVPKSFRRPNNREALRAKPVQQAQANFSFKSRARRPSASSPCPHCSRPAAEKFHEDDRSTCEPGTPRPGTPREAWSRRVQRSPSRQRVAIKRSVMSPQSSLYSSLGQQWGLL